MEAELKKMFGGQGKRNDKNGKGKFVVVQEIAQKLGVGYSQLKKIKAIHNYEPNLIKDIDDGKMSVSKAYSMVQTKHFNNNKIKKSDFEKEFTRILKSHEPSKKEILSVLNKTHPYSLEDFSSLKAPQSQSLKKKVPN